MVVAVDDKKQRHFIKPAKYIKETGKSQPKAGS